MKRLTILLIIVLLALTLTPALAQAPDGTEYIVQADDWLSKIAEKTYGDPLAYPAIIDATNAKAAEDDSFAVIDDPNVIEVGQKLWLPTEPDHDDFVTQGVDFAAYNSDENAADLVDIRQAMGYDRIIYYGQSYGTLLGQYVMRNHPEILEAVILDGIAPATAARWSDVTDMSGAFQRVFEACAADEACAARCNASSWPKRLNSGCWPA